MGLLNSQFPPAMQNEILAIVSDAMRDGDVAGGVALGSMSQNLMAMIPTNGLGVSLATVKAKLPSTANKLAQVVAGTRPRMTIARIGDSTEVGAHIQGVSGFVGNRPMAMSNRMAVLLNANGVPARNDSFWGNNNITGNIMPTTYDTRIAAGANWIASATVTCQGTHYLTNATALSTQTLTFLPDTPVNSFDVWYPTNATLGTFNLSRTGDTTTGTISQVTGSPGYSKVTFTGALGNANPIVLTPVSIGSGVFIHGIAAWDSTKPGVEVFNWGWNSGGAANVITNTTPFDCLGNIQSIQPDLVIYSMMINEWASATTIGTLPTPAGGTFLGNFKVLYDAVVAYGGELIVTAGFPSAKTATAWATQRQYVDAMKAYCAQLNIVFNDIHAEWGSWEHVGGSQTAGYYFDTLHPKVIGADQRVQGEVAILLSLLT